MTLKRIKDWFHNHRSVVSSVSRASTKDRKIKKLIPTKNSRRELAINAYWRLFNDRLTPALQAATLAYTGKKIPPGAFRNKWLKEQLAEEPDDVKELVEKSIWSAGSEEIDFVAQIVQATTEEDRLLAVKDYQE